MEYLEGENKSHMEEDDVKVGTWWGMRGEVKKGVEEMGEREGWRGVGEK